MTIKLELIKVITRISRNNHEFIVYMTTTFSIQELCDILKINRNKYNYLKRTNQLNKKILEVKSCKKEKKL